MFSDVYQGSFIRLIVSVTRLDYKILLKMFRVKSIPGGLNKDLRVRALKLARQLLYL